MIPPMRAFLRRRWYRMPSNITLAHVALPGTRITPSGRLVQSRDRHVIVLRERPLL